MINLAVIELKDIIKYLVKITIIIGVVVFLTKYFSNFKTKLNVDKNSFLFCLDTVIPSISSVNKKEETITANSNVKPLKLALDLELGVIDSLSKNETNTVPNNETTENRRKCQITGRML